MKFMHQTSEFKIYAANIYPKFTLKNYGRIYHKKKTCCLYAGIDPNTAYKCCMERPGFV